MDSYTVKKILPRLLIAVIAVQLSYYITGFLVDVFNVLGNGIGSLILAPTGEAVNFTLDFGELGNAAAGIGFLFALGNIGPILAALVPLFIIAMLAILAVLFTLVFRQVLIAMLIVLAPIAFIAWILPNTEKVFKMWSSFFIKALVMYPMIVILLSSGLLINDVVSGLFDKDGDSIQKALFGIVQVVIMIAPFLLIPFTFKLAGGAIAGVANLSDGFSKRLAGSRKGPDGKPGTGLAGKTQGYMDRQRKGIASGVSPLGRGRFNPLRYVAADGINPRTGSARSIADFNLQRAAAREDIGNKGITDRGALNEFAQHGGSKRALMRRIQELESGPVATEASRQTARNMRGMYDMAGKSEYRAAALVQSAEFGGATPEGFTAVGHALRGRQGVAASVVSDAAFASRERNLVMAGMEMQSDGTIVDNVGTVENAITSARPSDLAGQRNLAALVPHIQRILASGTPEATELERNLQYALEPRFDTSPENKAIIEGVVGGLPPPPPTLPPAG